MKYWHGGLPLGEAVGAAGTGGFRYWHEGLPVDQFIQSNQLILPAGNLVLSASAPDVRAPIEPELIAGNLALSTSAPVALITIAKEVPSADLTLSAELVITQFAEYREPPSADLVLSASVVGFAHDTVNPNVFVPSADLTLTPSQAIRETSDFSVEPLPTNLVLSTSAPLVLIINFVLSANLVLSASAPTVDGTTSAAIEVPSADLRLTTSAVSARFVITWSTSDETICPGEITVDLITETKSGGRSITGKKQMIQVDAGFWRIVLGRIRIRSNDDVLAWRERTLLLNGRSGTMLVPVYDRKRAPIPLGGASIIATADAPVSRGAVTMTIKVTQGAVLEDGMHFSTGERLYRLVAVGAPTGSPPVYSVTFRPPAREAIADDAALEFDHPVCRCRLESDDGMAAALDLMKYATPTVPFVEDY